MKWWKNKSEIVLHKETGICEDLSLKVQNIYITSAIIISVHFDIHLINLKLLWSSMKMIPKNRLVIQTPVTSNNNVKAFRLHVFYIRLWSDVYLLSTAV